LGQNGNATASGSRRRTNEGLKSVASLQGAATRFRETKGELGITLASSAIGAIEMGKQECFHGCQSEGLHNNSCKKLAKGYGYYQFFPATILFYTNALLKKGIGKFDTAGKLLDRA